MRSLIAIPLLAFTLAACTSPMSLQQRSGPVAKTPFTWKADTLILTRRNDIFECELAGRGLTPGATEAEVAAATAASDPERVAAFVSRCLANKGYTQVDMPVCTRADYNRGSFVVRPDVLPPLERIRCADPTRGGFIVV